MNFSEKLPAFANPQGAAGKLLIASMNIFHTPVSLWGISHLDLAGNEKILDIGCGGGINLSRFLKKVPRGHVTGIDLSPDCVNYSFMRNRDAIAEGRCSVYEGSAELLPFGANHFDVITAFETIYFWPNLPNTLKEIKRVLKPGGTFLIVNEADGYGFLDNLYPKIIKGMTLYKTEGDVKIYIEKILANFKSAMALIESAKNTPEPQIVKAPEGQDEEMELPIEALDDRSADLFEGEVKADTAEAETDEAEDETQQAVSEI